MDSFLDFSNADAVLAKLAEELSEEKIPVQHVTDSVGKVLGTKSAVKFITHLKPGAEKHTSWNKVNDALVKQGVKTPHIAKIATHVKPAQFKEDVDVIDEGLGRGREDDEYHTPDPTTRTHKIAFDVSKDGAEKHNRTVTISNSTKSHEEAKSAAKAHLEKQGYKIHEASDTVQRDASGKVKSWAHVGDWKKIKGNGTVTDKSGAKHGAMSAARHLARTAMRNVLNKEEVSTSSGERKAFRMGTKHGATGQKKIDAQKSFGSHAAAYHRGYDSGKEGAEWHATQADKQHKFKESADMCNVCGQTPCNCTHINEGADQHKVIVTVSDPNHSAVSMRKEKIMKRVIVSAKDKAEAHTKAASFYKKKGYKVHDTEYHSAQPKSSLKTEALELQEGAYEKAEENKRSADSAKKQGDMFAHHLHMADHHDNMAEWHDSKGRHSSADSHMKKSEEHHAQAMKLKEEVQVAEAVDKKQQLRDALNRHTEKAIAANRNGDDEAVKVHQGYMNKIKDKMAKLARNEEVELGEEIQSKE